ncbi:aspartate carbamoyltransferase catalytic subunit [Bdellovibrio sp. HCB337]|uniref:aspartate carbamoyltransferase catalytic subunit n=1 Tax=Bdellovibrio sp. HCB337 TaxID=3394358 RepID=UPI0039A711FC
MSQHSSALIEIANLNFSQIQSLFLSALEFSKNPGRKNYAAQTAALLFFEPSTRTRFSFETAAARLGLHPLLLDGGAGTSLEKGESIEDTVLNIAAMESAALIIRCKDDVDLYALQKQIKMPILNAGWGRKAHPSQALLDALTLKANGRDFEKEKLLVIGDVKHSRVIGSHFQLAKILGYQIAVCGPQSFLPENYSGLSFEKLEDGLKWATSVMALRVQHERHEEVHSVATYREQYGLNLQKLKSWKSDGLLMHPGPINYGVELDVDVNQDPRCKILEQVKWGAYIRQALLERALSERTVS